MPTYMKSATPVRLASLTGFIAVISEEPVFVPDECVREALALGCVKADEEFAVGASDTLTEDEKKAELRSAIQALVAKNNPKDFNVDGSPRVHSVRRLVNFHATSDEVRMVFESLMYGVED